MIQPMQHIDRIKQFHFPNFLANSLAQLLKLCIPIPGNMST